MLWLIIMAALLLAYDKLAEINKETLEFLNDITE